MGKLDDLFNKSKHLIDVEPSDAHFCPKLAVKYSNRGRGNPRIAEGHFYSDASVEDVKKAMRKLRIN
ncbi:MAG: hypothetical protein WC169_04325 [Dehalococcoidia bacterium]|jgi:hypothetical protein